jgi:hypothetical protein
MLCSRNALRSAKYDAAKLASSKKDDLARARVLGVCFIALIFANCVADQNEDTSSEADDGQDQTTDDNGETIEDACLALGAPNYENFAQPFFLTYCTGCHSSRLTSSMRQGAPVGIDFDRLDAIRNLGERILARTVDAPTMPPAGGPSQSQREELRHFIECGSPGDGSQDFDPMWEESDDDSGSTEACAQPREPLPAALLPRCAAATRDCFLACRDGIDDAQDPSQCEEACLKADTTPAAEGSGGALTCQPCVQLQELACGERAGCGDANASLLCCIEACNSSADPNCLAQTCGRELESFSYCYAYRAPQCLSVDEELVSQCFAAVREVVGAAREAGSGRGSVDGEGFARSLVRLPFAR